MPCKVDLSGNVYGRLTVTAEAERLPGKKGAHWICRCECGNTVTVSAYNLKRGHTKSCGCIKSPDLTGSVFGKLTVLGKSDKRRSRSNGTVPMWECRCECGAITYRTADILNMRESSMCSACAAKYTAEAARACAGYVDGTMLSRIIHPKVTAANSSGYCGVYYDKNVKKYRAQLKFKGKVMKFGSYAKLEDAVAARKKAEEKYFGEFIREYESRIAESATDNTKDNEIE